jgi:protein-arginine kinase activator protein McsA
MILPKCETCKEKGEVVWVDNGPQIRYYYCRTCKNEVNPFKNIKPPGLYRSNVPMSEV